MEEIAKGVSPGDARSVVFGVALESRVERELSGHGVQDGFVFLLDGDFELANASDFVCVGVLVAEHAEVNIGGVVIDGAAAFHQDVG